MPFCNVCKYEYVEGIKRCPDCDVDLVDKLSEEEIVPKIEDNEEELVTIFSTNDDSEAFLIKDTLESAGIGVYKQPGSMNYRSKLLSPLSVTTLSVFKSNALEAIRLIKLTK
jgi:hypothetical protein